MKYIIDSEICEKHGISLEAVLYLLTLSLGKSISQETIREAWRLGAVMVRDIDSNGNIVAVSLEKHGVEIVNEIISDSTYNPTGEDRYLRLAEQLIELYPKGRKEGTAYMWRDSKSVIAKRLETLANKLKKTTGQTFTDEQAINATKAYVASFNGDYTYMQLLKYFISKRIIREDGSEEVSQLLSYIENEGQENLTNSGWTDRVI